MWEANNIMNILVTGALGNVGICTINELLKNKDNYIIGIDNCITRSTNRLLHINDPNNRFTFINSNNTFNTFFDIEDIFRENNFDAILHLAGRVGTANSFKEPKSYIENNVLFITELLDLSVRYNINRFVFASSSVVYGTNYTVPSFETHFPKPNSVYGVSKYAAELLAKVYYDTFKLNTIGLRYYNIIPPIEFIDESDIIYMFAKKILNNETIRLYNNGKQLRQYVPIDNIVLANILALTTNNKECFGEVFNISVDCNPISLESLVLYIARYYDVDCPKIEYIDDKAIGDVDVCFGSIEKAKKLLGYKPKVDMYEYINNILKYVRNSNNAIR